MEVMLQPVGIREVKNHFSALTEKVNVTGRPLTVLKNNKPWVVIAPVDSAAASRRARRERFRMLTARIEGDIENEPQWDEAISDKELLGEERMRRFG